MAVLTGDDRPEKPRNLSEIEDAFWEESIATAEHLRHADTTLAVRCAKLYGLSCEAEAAAQCDVLDKDARAAYLAYHGAWKGAIERLCLDPLGRDKASQRVRRGGDEDEETTEEKYFGVTG